jgi:hypothetical protein
MFRAKATLSILLIFSLGILFSCKKTKDTTALVKVINENGLPISGASVRLFGEGTIDESGAQVPRAGILLDNTKSTDSKGEALFDYTEYYKSGQAGFAVLNVEIEKVYPDSIATLEGIIKVEEEVKNEKTFTLK